MTTFIANIPKLMVREHYDEWAFAAENLMIIEGVEIQRRCIKKIDVSEDLHAQNPKLKLVLIINPSLYVHIKNTKTAKELWNTLKTMFDNSGFKKSVY